MILLNEKNWIIVSKDRKVIAKGVPRNRYLCELSDTTDKGRILTYSSKSKAESAFKHNGFYNQNILDGYPKWGDEGWYEKSKLENFLEAIECNMIIEI